MDNISPIDVLILCADYGIEPDLLKERHYDCKDLQKIVASDDFDALEKYVSERF